MRILVLVVALSLWSSCVWAGDGADSPEQINKSTRQLAKVAHCRVRSGELNFAPVPCKARATKDKTAASGAILWIFEYRGKGFWLDGTLAPENGKLTFEGTSTCASKDKPTRYSGVLFRKSPNAWEGDLTPQIRSGLCGVFQLSMSK